MATTSYKPFASLLRGSELREVLEATRKEQRGAADHVNRTMKNDAVPGLDAKLEQDPPLHEQTRFSISEEDDSAGDALKIAVSSVAVAPTWQKHGLASKLLARVVEEIYSQANAQGRNDFTLVLLTMKEMNGPYWTSKGVQNDRRRKVFSGSFRKHNWLHAFCDVWKPSCSLTRVLGVCVCRKEKGESVVCTWKLELQIEC